MFTLFVLSDAELGDISLGLLPSHRPQYCEMTPKFLKFAQMAECITLHQNLQKTLETPSGARDVSELAMGLNTLFYPPLPIKES